MSHKEDLLRETVAEFGALQRALAGLSAEDLAQPWLGDWSIREILAHIAGWHREVSPALHRIARGDKPFPDGVSLARFDEWNARFVAARRGLTVEGIRAELVATHRDLLAAARAVPDPRFAPGRSAARLLEGVGPHHYREHGDQIRAWRRRAGR